jgi:hypothetical protein
MSWTLKYTLPNTIKEWPVHTYNETVIVRDGIAEVKTEPAKDYLLKIGFVEIKEEAT